MNSLALAPHADCATIVSMNTALRFLLALGTGALLAGCAVHTKEEIADARTKGLSARTLSKIEHRGTLTPENIIELKNRRVSDDLVIRHLDTIGVDYIPQKEDIKRLRSAGVRQEVITSVVRAGNRFVGYLNSPPPQLYYSYSYWGDPYYPYGPRGYYEPWWPRNDVGLRYSYGRRHYPW